MKRVIPFLLFLSGIACASGYLMSKLTGIGKIGITLMHREYQFLKIWWEGAIAVFLGLLILFSYYLANVRRDPERLRVGSTTWFGDFG